MPDVLHHLEMLSEHISATTAEVLNAMKTSRLLDVMGETGATRAVRRVAMAGGGPGGMAKLAL